MSLPKIAGLDLETTGLSLEHQVVQVGVALPGLGGLSRPAVFARDIGWPIETLSIDRGALEINRFTIERITAGERASSVDATLAAWLRVQGVKDHELVALGWNVGAFDLPRFQRTLPHSARFFHPYRAVDLNSLCYFVGLHLEEDPAAVKSACREYVARNRMPAAWHDAGYDAAGALLVLQWLLAGLRNEREPATF